MMRPLGFAGRQLVGFATLRLVAFFTVLPPAFAGVLLPMLAVLLLPAFAGVLAQTKGFSVAPGVSGQPKGVALVPKAAAAPGENRVALVIGNARYRTGPLRNPVNDARAMAATLREVGFEVMALENANQAEMKQAIFNFGRRLRDGGGVGLFYYSGHGMQVDGRNWMIPVGARVEVEQHVELEGVEPGRVLAEMESARNRLNIVILDACRNNPFARSFRSNAQGLATMDAPSGTIVAYATAPGRVAADGSGANSPFTSELVRAMRRPGLKLEEVFKRARVAVKARTGDQQIPWESSSLTGDFYFIPAQAVAPSAIAAIPALAAPALVAPGSASGGIAGARFFGGLGLLAYGVLQYSKALSLHGEASDKRDSDPDRSLALQEERDDAVGVALGATLLGTGLIVWAWMAADGGGVAVNGPPAFLPVVLGGRSGVTGLAVAAAFRW